MVHGWFLELRRGGRYGDDDELNSAHRGTPGLSKDTARSMYFLALSLLGALVENKFWFTDDFSHSQKLRNKHLAEAVYM